MGPPRHGEPRLRSNGGERRRGDDTVAVWPRVFQADGAHVCGCHMKFEFGISNCENSDSDDFRMLNCEMATVEAGTSKLHL